MNPEIEELRRRLEDAQAEIDRLRGLRAEDARITRPAFAFMHARLRADRTDVLGPEVLRRMHAAGEAERALLDACAAVALARIGRALAEQPDEGDEDNAAEDGGDRFVRELGAKVAAVAGEERGA